MQPSIIVDAYNPGVHNSNGSIDRVRRQGLYKDASTICLIPTRGLISWRVVQSWLNLASPMNAPFVRMGITGYEVGAAYSTGIEQILNTPGLSDFKYILTLEEDNLPPPDGLLKLAAAMHEHPEYDAIGGLYWTKGEGGQPMIYGNPNETPLGFTPQPPVPGELVPCNGLGMGFTLFRLEMFRDDRLKRPFFETIQRYTPDGAACFTQDLDFFHGAAKVGHRFACHCGVHVGHYDQSTDIVW